MSQKASKNAVRDTEVVNAVSSTLGKLSEDYNAWKNNEYARSNEALYKLMGGIMDVHQDGYLKASPAAKAEIRKELEAKLKASNVRVQKNSHPLTMFVKCTFGGERKTAAKYASVIKCAIADKQTGKTFVEWVKDNGGIEEISRKKTSNPETRAKREASEAEQLRIVGEQVDAAKKTPLARVEFDDSVRLDGTCLLIAQSQPDGTAHIIGALSNVPEGLLSRVHLEMGKMISEASLASAVNESKGVLIMHSVSKKRTRIEAVNDAAILDALVQSA